MTSALQRVLPVFFLAFLASALRAEERIAAIRDDAGLFRADAIAQAERQSDDIRRTFDRNLFVDTVKSAHPRERKWFRFLWTRQVNRILEEQAQKRARESGVDGIFVVICNDPKDVHVVVRPGTDPAFTRRDAEDLRRAIVRRLQDSGPDKALLALVSQVHGILEAHAARGQSASVVNEFVLAGLLGGGLALWLVLCAIRFQIRARRGSHMMETSADEQARRTPALLGAMFGHPAGQWIYDKLYPSPARSPTSIGPVAIEGEDAEKTEAQTHPADESPADVPVSPG